MTSAVVAICERCGRLFYRTPGKFCDVPACQGWVHHIDRTRVASDEEGR
jgi:rRNA maturation endonuclease Nob1